MAATEYYMGTAAAQQLGHIRPPAHELPGQQQMSYQYSPPANLLQPYNDKPPTYSPYPTQQSPQQQPRPLQSYQPQQYQQRPQGYQQPYPPPPASHSPHPPTSTPQTRPQGYPQQQNAHLGVPLQHHRSHSQPPRVRFADRDEYSTDSGSYASDSLSSSRRRHKRHRHHHHRRSYDHDSRDRGSDSDIPRSDPLRSAHSKSRKNRDTFLGAGAGGVIGDAIFPGLGTVGGLLLGGYGGRKRASKKEEDRNWDARETESDGESRLKHRRQRHRHHRSEETGWDEGSRTYRKGLAVR